MQSFMLLAAFGILGNGPDASSQDAKVTFESRAQRVELLFPELSKTAGIRLMFSPQTKDEVLILSVQDVRLNDLIEKIANATSAEWQKENGGYRLIRSAKLLKKLEDEHFAKVVEAVALGQERLRKSLESAGEYSDTVARSISEKLSNYLSELTQRGDRDLEYRKLEMIRPILPGYRLALRIAATLDPKALAAIPARERAVFSTQPNRLQKPFPKSLQPALASYAKEVEMLAAHLPDEPKMPEMGVEANVWQALMLRQRKDAKPSKILLSVTSPAENRSSMLQLMVANEKGTIIERSYISLSPVDPMNRTVLPAKPPVPEPGEKLIELSPLSKEYSEYVSKVYQPNPAVPTVMSRELREFLLNPEKNETTALVFSEVVLATAKERNLNVVISPPYGAMGPGSGKDMTPSKFLTQYRTSPFGGTTVSLENGWLEARPSDWFQVRNNAPDRFALGRFLRIGASRSHDLEDHAALALAMPSQSAHGNAMNVFMLLYRNSYDRYSHNDFDLLRLHGSLTVQQRRAATSDGLPFAGLSPWQKRQVESMVYGENTFNMDWQYQGRTEEPEGPHSNIMFQPTERYANGVPLSAMLNVRDESKRTIRCTAQTPQGITLMQGDENNLARILMSKERPDIRIYGPERDWNEFTVMDQTAYKYTLQTEPRLTHNGRLQFVKSASKPVDSIDKLPPDILEKVNAQLVKLREAYKNYKPPP